MATEADETTGESRDRKLIREAKEEAFHARRALRREMPSPSGEAKRKLASALADYRDVLSDYRDERALDTDWDDRDVDVDVLDELLASTTTSRETLPRRGSPTQEVEVQLVTQVASKYLIEIAKELDAIAKELGFAAVAKQPTPSEEADMSDLRSLMRARGQTQALEQLPGNPDGDGDE